MTIEGKFIIQVQVAGTWLWWNGAKPFVADINKAFICPDQKSVDKNVKRITDFYQFPCKIIPLSITA